VELGQSTPGDTNITFNGVTVENTDGDGMAVLPQLGTCCGINTNITFENGAMTNIGYHTLTPEGVNGLKILNDDFANDRNFMDMEVDNNDAQLSPGTAPTGNAQWNITIKDNRFTAFDGNPSYFPNTILVPCITLQGVTGATLSGNVCTNAYDVVDNDNAQFPSTDFSNSDITTCHNTYGLTWPTAPVGEAAPAAAPKTEIGCSSEAVS